MKLAMEYSRSELETIIRKSLGLKHIDNISFCYKHIPPANYQETAHDELTGFIVETE